MAEIMLSDHPTPVVGVLPLGDAPLMAANVIAAHVSGYLNLGAETLPPLAIPRQALDPGRLQYNAGILIQSIEVLDLPDYFKVIALVDVDLFIPLFTHVFGEARQNGRVALVSLYRLQSADGGAPPSTERVLERTAKIALHELGHLLNLLHCDDERCLMHFSGRLEALDHTALNYCRYCRRTLHRAIVPRSNR
jgi:archaemetzincin